MKGATAEPCVSTISAESNNIVTRIGASHHFLRTRMNAQSSPKIESLLDDCATLVLLAPVCWHLRKYLQISLVRIFRASRSLRATLAGRACPEFDFRAPTSPVVSA